MPHEIEERFRSLAQAAYEGLMIHEEGIILDANQAFAELLGFRDPDELIGKPGVEVLPLTAESKEAIQRHIRSSSNETYEISIVRPDGSVRIAETQGRNIAYRGRQARVVAMRDITNRKKMEKALRQSEALYQSLVEQLPQCVFRKDLAGHFTFCNQKFCELLRLDQSEVLGKTDFDLFPHELAEKYRQDDLRIMESGQPWTAIERHRPRGVAEEMYVEVIKSPLQDDAGEVSGIQGMFWEVTERHRAAEALRASEARLKEAERLAHLGSWEADLASLEDFSQNALFWSDETFRIFGYEPGAVPVTHDIFSRGIHPEDRAGVWAAVQEALRERKPYSAEHRVVRPDGSERTVLEHAEIMFDEATDRPSKFIGTVQDITDRKQAEVERTLLEQQILQAQKIEAVGRLAGGVAHDFNNMLQAILGHAELALKEAPLADNLRESLEEIQKAALRSANLTHQLLAFARKQTVSPQALDLNDTVSGMLKMLRRLIGENLQLLWMPGADLWTIKMDPSQIDQILANLMVNARDAIEDVGKVTIETANVTLDETYVNRHPECVPGNFVMLAVSDTGRGMNKETQARIFEPFFTTKEIGKGTGLGLAIVFGIVKQNNGFIYAYSEPGQGTTFKVYFPRIEEEARKTKPPVAPRSLQGTETVLLVEDEEQILNLGRLILEQHGYTVMTACSPASAIALASQHQGPIHLLITDVVMPGMNGRELKQQLIKSYPDLKCLFVSGYTADAIAHSGILDAGVSFLPKPFTVRTLTEKVREVIET